MTPDRRKTVLLDTNVWLDYLIEERSGHSSAMALIERVIDTDEAELCCYAGSLKDVYFIFLIDRKRRLREEFGEVSERDARALNEIAWAAIEAIEGLVSVIPSDTRTVWLARKMKRFCADFEDCLVLAACELSGANFLVTGDEGLRKVAPVKAGNAEEILPYL